MGGGGGGGGMYMGGATVHFRMERCLRGIGQ